MSTLSPLWQAVVRALADAEVRLEAGAPFSEKLNGSTDLAVAGEPLEESVDAATNPTARS